jgi:hypothetical protein
VLREIKIQNRAGEVEDAGKERVQRCLGNAVSLGRDKLKRSY